MRINKIIWVVEIITSSWNVFLDNYVDFSDNDVDLSDNFIVIFMALTIGLWILSLKFKWWHLPPLFICNNNKNRRAMGEWALRRFGANFTRIIFRVWPLACSVNMARNPVHFRISLEGNSKLHGGSLGFKTMYLFLWLGWTGAEPGYS